MKRSHVLSGIAAATLFLSACGVYTSTEPANRTSLNIKVTTCALGGSVDLVLDGLAGPYPSLSTPGEIQLQVGPGPHSLTFRRDNHDIAENTAGDPLDTLRTLGPGQTTSISVIDPPWGCVAASSGRVSPLR